MYGTDEDDDEGVRWLVVESVKIGKRILNRNICQYGFEE